LFLKIVFAEKRKKSASLTQIAAIYTEKDAQNIGFQENHLFR
jgi:hypothetical protein